METPGGGSPGNVELVVPVSDSNTPHEDQHPHKCIDFQRNTPVVADDDGVCSASVDELLRVDYLLGFRILR